jgi:GNAT superfamily N-acetyltransferase
MMANIKTRKAVETDMPAIAEILRELGFFARINAEPAAATEQRVRHHFDLCCRNDDHSIYVAENDRDEVVGYAAVHWLPYLLLSGLEGYVSELFVRPSAQGQGVGTLLLDVMKEEGEARGCSRLSLLNMRNRDSYRRGFYKKAGWQEREHAANFVLPLV